MLLEIRHQIRYGFQNFSIKGALSNPYGVLTNTYQNQKLGLLILNLNLALIPHVRLSGSISWMNHLLGRVSVEEDDAMMVILSSRNGAL